MKASAIPRLLLAPLVMLLMSSCSSMQIPVSRHQMHDGPALSAARSSRIVRSFLAAVNVEIVAIDGKAVPRTQNPGYLLDSVICDVAPGTHAIECRFPTNHNRMNLWNTRLFSQGSRIVTLTTLPGENYFAWGNSLQTGVLTTEWEPEFYTVSGEQATRRTQSKLPAAGGPTFVSNLLGRNVWGTSRLPVELGLKP
jgi:hypothetical protein